MFKSFLDSVVVKATEKDVMEEFIAKVHTETSIPKVTIKSLYETALKKSNKSGKQAIAEAKAHVYLYVQKSITEAHTKSYYQIWDEKDKKWIGKPSNKINKLLKQIKIWNDREGHRRFDVEEVS